MTRDRQRGHPSGDEPVELPTVPPGPAPGAAGAWILPFASWAHGRTEKLDFEGLPVPTRVQELLHAPAAVARVLALAGWWESTGGAQGALQAKAIREAINAYRPPPVPPARPDENLIGHLEQSRETRARRRWWRKP